MKIRIIDRRFSFIEGPKEIYKIIAVAKAKTKGVEFPRNPISIKLNRHSNTSNIVEIHDSLLARKNNNTYNTTIIVIFITHATMVYIC